VAWSVCLVSLLFFLFVSLFRSPVVSALSFCACPLSPSSVPVACGGHARQAPAPRAAPRHLGAEFAEQFLTVMYMF
jgi:hypothetical protein